MKERVKMAIRASLAAGITAWLYYHSVWGMTVLVPVWIWYYRNLKREYVRKRQREFLLQFKELIQIISSALTTGYSIENAVKESQKEMRLLYSEKELISRELMILAGKLRMHIPIEQAVQEMADRVRLEDVESFAAVFVTAKRSRGDLTSVIRNTAEQIAGKVDVYREIQTVLAAKRYEFKVMSVVPHMMIAYISLSFPEFVSCLYGNIIGTGVMTICLIIYISAYYLGVRLIEIEV